jgi:Protein of unknown function (DUF1203)
MSELRIIAIASELADQVRATMVSPGYGHPVTAKVATGLGPCRHCLQPFAVGEETRLLFTLNPFDGVASIPQPGPVFLHEDECKRYGEEDEYPEGLLQLGALLDGYDAEQMIRRRELVAKDVSPETLMREMLMDPLVRYVVVRDPNAGCYRMRVERREGTDG